ncbi:MAG TPA: hypothetical protein VKA21_15505 [Candidatus Binatia bacterium]|nr:hypothetical protein [Candidatus Binatia bacterium]
MQSVVGIFRSPETACQAVDALRRAGVPPARIGLLMPGIPPKEVASRVPTDEGEPPGMGAAVGGVIGGAVGLSAAAIILPGIGPLVLAGLLAAGLVGTAGGAAVGDTLEDVLSNGVPRDDLPIYQGALARGRSVVVGSVETDEDAERVRAVFRAANAESVDAAREDWLTGLHDASRPSQ